MIKKILAIAESELGYTEGANNLNKFAPIVHHRNNQPWCATFISAIFKLAGCEKAILNSASVLEIANWGKKKGLEIPVKKAKTGDLIILDFTKDKKGDHIEIATSDFNSRSKFIKTIGGNTGDINQSNGDGVYRKIRWVENICLVIRPDWGACEAK